MSNKASNRSSQRSYTDFMEAGLQLILKNGYDNVTVSDIAREADYGRSTFYLHFEDKEDLALQLLLYQTKQLDNYMLDTVKKFDHPRREWEAWRIIVGTTEMQKQFFLQMNGDLSHRLRMRQTVELHATFEKNLTSGFYDYGLPDVPPAFQARFLVGAVQHVLEYWLRHPDMGDADTIAAYFFEMLFRQKPTFNDEKSENIT